MTKSRRLKVLMASLILFVIGVIFHHDPIALGTGITLLTAPYLLAETTRKSE